MLKALGAARKKTDRLDARKSAGVVRGGWLPVCWAAPPQIRELVVRQAVRGNNKIAGLWSVGDEDQG